MVESFFLQTDRFFVDMIFVNIDEVLHFYHSNITVKMRATSQVKYTSSHNHGSQKFGSLQ